MESVKSFFMWFVTNWDNFLLALMLVTVALEAIVKLTPTKTDDGFVSRLGAFIDKLSKWMPNNVKKPEGFPLKEESKP